MNAPLVVAQANSTGSTTGTGSLRTIKVSKPQGDQAVTVQLGYDQNYKLDLSGIANEKITLVHIGEKLIILFDNKSTVTVEPFFDSMNAPLSNVTVEANGRDFTGGEFASAFPITTDQSVLTAAGVAAAGSPASGADFHGPSVDPLSEPTPLPLLGQEELGNFVTTPVRGFNAVQTSAPDTTPADTTPPETTPPSPPVDNSPIAVADTNWVQEHGSVTTGNVLADQAHNGAPAGTFADHADTFGADEFGAISWTGEANGAVGGAHGTLTVDANGNYSYAVNNSDASVVALGNGASLTDTFTYTVTDGDGDAQTATLTVTIFGSDHGVTITGLTSELDGGDATVNEANLSDGSSPDNAALTQTGTFTISTPDGLDDLTVGGHVVILNGAFQGGSLLTTLGNTLTFTGFNPATGEVTYTYTLADNEAHAPIQGANDLFENFGVVVTDTDGSTASDTLSVRILDDVPTVAADTNWVKEDTNTVATGNVFQHIDHAGAPAGTFADNVDAFGADGFGGISWTGEANGTVGGAHGTLTVDASGNYTYAVNNSDASVVALGNDDSLTDTFTYTVTDGDGDAQTATLTVTIFGSDHGVIITGLTSELDGGDATVNEANLSDGSSPDNTALTQTGTFTISTPDGLDDLTVGGQQVINNGVFTATSFSTPLNNTLSITGFNPATGEVTYTYTLLDNETHAPIQGTNSLFENFAVVVTDTDGSSASDTLSVRIVDDVPAAQIQTFEVAGLSVDETVPSGDEAADPFSYGTPLGVATQGLVLSLGSTPGADDLGSSTHITVEIVGGDGMDSDLTTTSGTAIHLFLNGGIIEGRVDGSSDVAFALTIDDSGQITVAQYLSLHHLFANSANDAVNLAGKVNAVVTVTDGDGDVATSSAGIGGSILFFDDAPTAVADTNWAQENGPVATGNVLADQAHNGAPAGTFADHVDTFGADGVGAISWNGAANGTVGGAHGTLTVGANGDYSYAVNNSDALVVALGNGDSITDKFTYTITDGDGDAQSATLTVTIFGSDHGVTITGIGAETGDETVNEANLANGTSPDNDALTQTGTFNISAQDGFGDLTISGVNVVTGGSVTLPGSPITTTYGQLTITDVNLSTGVVSYSYTLTADALVPGTATFDNVPVHLTDADTSFADSTLTIKVVDDAPQAVADSNTATEGGAAATGNVLSNDLPGADGYDAGGGVVGVKAGSDTSIPASGGLGGAGIPGTYGTLILNAGGTYSYAPNVSVNSGSTDVFTYTVMDKDGDTSTATLTITFAGDNNVPTASNATATTNEASGDNQLAGSNADAFAAQISSGTMSFSYGLDGPAAVTPFSASYDSGLGAASLTSLAGVTTFTSASWTLTINETTGAYIFTQTAAYQHDLGATTDNGIVTVTLKDSDGSTVTKTVTLTINDDVPHAVADSNTATEGGAAATGNVLSNDNLGADHGTVGADAHVSNIASNNVVANHSVIAASGSATIAGQYGSLTFNADGTYSYAPQSNINNPSPVTDTFTYTVMDKDGDISTATLAITINDGANPTAGSPITLGVDEAALSTAGATGSNPLLTTETASTTLSFTAGSDNLTSFAFSNNLSGLVTDLNGDTVQDIFWVRDSGTQISGYLDAAHTLLADRLTLSAPSSIVAGTTGSVTVTETLSDNLVHPTAGGPQVSSLGNIGVVATDVDGDAMTGTVNLTVKDDMPSANEVTKPLTPTGHDTNIMLILDVSGSMGDNSGLTGLSRLAVMKAAVNELLEQYGDLGDVRVQIVQFSSGASQASTDWMTLGQAKAAVNALIAGGTTDYDVAVATAQSIFTHTGKLSTAGVQNVSYFMSDGVPNEDNGTGTDGIVGTEITNWQNFLHTNSIDSFALGMGAGSTPGALNPLAFNGVTNTDTNALIVTDMGQLTATLVGTISGTSGNILTDGVVPGSFGADGGFVKSITVDGTVYTFDPASGGSISISGSNHGSFDTTTNTETVTLTSGGVLTMVMDNGTYGFTAPANVSAGFTDSVDFLLIDNDGDTAGNTLTITVSTQDHKPLVRDDHVITNAAAAGGADQIVIPDWALLFNDSDPEGQAIAITGVNGAVSGSVGHAGSNVTFTEDSGNATDGGSFTYTGATTSPAASDTGDVSVDRSQTGSTLTGTGLGEILMGRDGTNNIINANEGNDVLIAGNGNDTLDGGAGNDLMAGGAGNDTYIVDSANDAIIENSSEGTDTVQAFVSYLLGANLENLTLTGSANINGTGNSLDNVITGNTGNNVLSGAAGNDTLDGGAGTDTLVGGIGNDTYLVDSATDTITENSGEGTDTVQSSVTFSLAAIANVENLTLTGGNNINGTGNGLDNVITGNSGNNTLDGGAGTDTLVGGAGNDSYVVDSTTDTITDSAGTDTVQSSVTFSLAAIANVENLTLTGGNNINGTGNSLNNVITGNSGDNTLDGGTGTDTLVGGAGNDTYLVDSTTDTITEGSNAGTDTVQSSVTFSLAAIANVENLTLTGGSNLNGTGNSLNNVITGNSGDNTLDGGAGTDTLVGGAGNDSYVVDSTTDTITEGSNAGTDTVQSSVTYTLGANVENLTLTGGNNISGTGNGLDNVITGNSGDNTLDGGAGADTLVGGAGNDTYIVDNVGDVVTESNNQGTDTVQSSITFTLGANVENLTLTGGNNINGTGNSSSNVITGNSGDNTLDGGTGADTLIGGAGNDTYIVDNTSDNITENANQGTDTVLSSVDFSLASNMENLTLTGSGNNDATGNSLDNVLIGNSGNNTITGGAGKDTMTGNGGADTFDFNATTESGNTVATADVITDFVHNQDKIDLSSIDASPGPGGSSTFTWGGTTATAHGAWFAESNGNTIISVDTDGVTATAEMMIVLTGINKKISAQAISNSERPS